MVLVKEWVCVRESTMVRAKVDEWKRDFKEQEQLGSFDIASLR